MFFHQHLFIYTYFISLWKSSQHLSDRFVILIFLNFTSASLSLFLKKNNNKTPLASHTAPLPIPTMAPRLGECQRTDGDRKPDCAVSGEAGGWRSRGRKQEEVLEEMKSIRTLRGHAEVRSPIWAYLSQTGRQRLTRKSKGDSKHSCTGQDRAC